MKRIPCASDSVYCPLKEGDEEEDEWFLTLIGQHMPVEIDMGGEREEGRGREREEREREREEREREGGAREERGGRGGEREERERGEGR